MEDDCEWAWLPKDLLHSILDQLQPMEDVIRFSAVCTEWRSVAVENFESRSLHRRQVPFLMSRTKDNIGNLHSVTQKKMYKFRFPMPDNMKCCGSSLGWLIMLDVTMDVILFNPFSGNTITFPPIRRLVFEKRYALEFDYIHGLSALKRYEYEIRIREEYGEEELENRLAFVKSGDEDWTYIDNKTSGFDYLFKTSRGVKGFRYFEDILYWKSQFYAVDSFGKLLSCEINTNFTNLRVKIVDVPKRGIGADPISTSTSFQEVVQSLRREVQSPFFEGNISVWSAFLVESVEGDLLWVPKFRSNFLTRKFSVYKLVDNGGNVGWVEKEDLGDAALFLGDNHSILVRCQPNSIYFVDKEDETVWCYPGYPFDMGVYNLEHKAVARDYQLNPSQRLNPPPIWILPTFM
ncbi:F-box protein At2g17036-like [Vitis riparia]|uniref:F-box protein At2g17036-like n=1 Tax=Vitis riparia TaxID=96939 RepID=UPI00155A6F10|nr:F-box protein At2g17036-like [Vitis riparia]